MYIIRLENVECTYLRKLNHINNLPILCSHTNYTTLSHNWTIRSKPMLLNVLRRIKTYFPHYVKLVSKDRFLSGYQPLWNPQILSIHTRRPASLLCKFINVRPSSDEYLG
jgi:hypothetical protein